MMTNTFFIGKTGSGSVDRLTARKGYKVVALQYDHAENTVKTVSPHYPDTVFSLSSDSRCSFNHNNFVDCACGFYAYKTSDKAVEHWEKECRGFSNFFVIEVALSGEVIVAEHGYKASHQRVTKIFLKTCWNCDKNGAGFALHDNGFLVPTCSECSSTSMGGEQFSALFSPDGFQPIQIVSSPVTVEQKNEDSVSINDIDPVQQMKNTIDSLSREGRLSEIDDIILHAKNSMFQGFDVEGEKDE